MSETQTDLVIFQEGDQPVEVRLDVRQETVWLTQRRMTELFETTPEKNVLIHLKNSCRDEDLEGETTTKDFLAVQLAGAKRTKPSCTNLAHHRLAATNSHLKS